MRIRNFAPNNVGKSIITYSCAQIFLDNLLTKKTPHPLFTRSLWIITYLVANLIAVSLLCTREYEKYCENGRHRKERLSSIFFTIPPLHLLSNSLEAIKGAAITDEEAHKAAVLGWALEWVSMGEGGEQQDR